MTGENSERRTSNFEGAEGSRSKFVE